MTAGSCAISMWEGVDHESVTNLTTFSMLQRSSLIKMHQKKTACQYSSPLLFLVVRFRLDKQLSNEKVSTSNPRPAGKIQAREVNGECFFFFFSLPRRLPWSCPWYRHLTRICPCSCALWSTAQDCDCARQLLAINVSERVGSLASVISA